MINCEEKFKKWDWVFVIELWLKDGCLQPFGTGAHVVEIDEESKTIKVKICGSTYRTYSYEDFGRLVFNNKELADKATKKYPKNGDTIYQVEDDKTSPKKVLGIIYKYVNGVMDLFIKFEDGKEVSSKEIGKTIFLKEEDIH